MSAEIILPVLSLEDAARRRRLEAAWRDCEVTQMDMLERGFTARDSRDARVAFGPKPRRTAMPQFGQVRR